MSAQLAVLACLPSTFRENAATLRRLGGSEEAARAWEQAAHDLDEALRAAQLEPLTLTDAAAESGFTRGHLRRMLRDGIIPNAGTDAGPRILRMHLPRKPGFGVDRKPVQAASSGVQAARAVVRGDG